MAGSISVPNINLHPFFGAFTAMVRTASTMLPLGTKAPDFSLPDTDGNLVSPASIGANKALLVVFMCNHCPYVKHIAPELSRLAKHCADKGIAMVGINSNDAENYPDDSPEMMKVEKERQGYDFPYLYDADQSVAIAYRAACTPDFYLFDSQHQLTYRGQLDSSRPGNDMPLDGADVRAAIDAMLAGTAPTADQKPSIGCNIKWKSGNAPDYFLG